jgi:nicotinamidase-related amidase
MVPRLSAFISLFSGAGGLTVFVKSVPWTERFLPNTINESYRADSSVRYWSNDESGRPEEFYGLPLQGILVFEKSTYDAFSSEDLNRALIGHGIRYVLFAGAFGDACVQASISGGFSRGFHPIILKDLIETTDDPRRQELQLLLMERSWPYLYGPVIDSALVSEALGIARFGLP